MLEIKEERRINARDLYEMLSVSLVYLLLILTFILRVICVYLNIKAERAAMEEELS